MADGGDPRVEEIPPSTEAVVEAVEDEEVVVEDEGAESVVDTSDLTTAILRRKVGALSLSILFLVFVSTLATPMRGLRTSSRSHRLRRYM